MSPESRPCEHCGEVHDDVHPKEIETLEDLYQQAVLEWDGDSPHLDLEVLVEWAKDWRARRTKTPWGEYEIGRGERHEVGTVRHEAYEDEETGEVYFIPGDGQTMVQRSAEDDFIADCHRRQEGWEIHDSEDVWFAGKRKIAEWWDDYESLRILYTEDVEIVAGEIGRQYLGLE